MLKWALIFLVVGIIAAVLGFTSIAGASFFVAKLLFFVCVVGFLIFVGLAVAAGRAVTK
jgi:uncharacterized membrane protein YtjA (UPF0391 family)